MCLNMPWPFVVQSSLVSFKLNSFRKERPNDKKILENKTHDTLKSSGVRQRSQRCVWQETQPWCHAMPRMGVVFSSSPRWWMMRHQWEPTNEVGTGIGTNVWSLLLCHKLKHDSEDWIAHVSFFLSLSLSLCVYMYVCFCLENKYKI